MTTTTQPITIVLADDNDFFRNGFKNIIAARYHGEVNFISEACNGAELVEQVALHKPHIAITDIKMPTMDGITATRIIRNQYNATKVIAMSVFEDTKYIMNMYQSGANGYLTKGCDGDDVIKAIRTVVEGKNYFCNTVSDKLFDNSNISKLSGRRMKEISFSTQEKKIMTLICRQRTTKEIAVDLKIATRTVDDYRHNIQEKIGARNVVGIALYALIHEIVALKDVS